MMPSMRLTPRPAESWRRPTVTTGKFLTVQSPRRERFDPRLLNSQHADRRKTCLVLRRIAEGPARARSRVERNFRATGIDEEGDLVTAVDPHADHRQRLGLHEFGARCLRPLPCTS